MKKVVVYTDGACSGNPGPGGYAAILMCGDVKKEISGGEADTTNNRMELRGPIEALKLLREKCDVEIYSDSSYVVDAFSKGWVQSWKNNGWKRKDGPLKNPELIKELYDLCQIHNVKWVKVKGHADNEFNNRCDELAVKESLKYKNGEVSSTDDTELVVEAVTKAVRDTEYSGDLYEKIIKTDTMFEGRVFKVEVSEVELPDGQKSTREIIRHNGGAAIVAIDEDKNIFLVKQYRIATGQELLEIPAGKLEVGEDPLECAKRELEEETGMQAGEIKHLFSMYATPGYCAERLHIYFTKGLKSGQIHRDEEEFLHVIKLPFDIAYKMVMNGQIFDAKTIAGILAAKELI